MPKQLTKGNEAIVKAAVLAGCRAFYGYPITPASEIAEAAALYLPRAGGVFIQAESEVAAINMLYAGSGAAVEHVDGGHFGFGLDEDSAGAREVEGGGFGDFAGGRDGVAIEGPASGQNGGFDDGFVAFGELLGHVVLLG